MLYFQINAASDALDDIRVQARSPSGDLQMLPVNDVDGLFTANFRPHEVGK